MDETCHVMKRKKRKTRRCLNEIRKKSRNNTNSAIKNIDLGTKMNNNVSKMVGSTSHNNFITSNRLTLAIFPKAVRSETITRPLLAEIRHEPGNINLNNIVRNKYALKPETTVIEKAVETHTSNANNSANMFSDDDSEDNSKENCINSVIFRMDCASDAAGDSDEVSMEGPSPCAAASPAPDSPAPGLQEQYAYSRYRQFIKEIPMYLQMHAPSLLTEDPMKKPKAMLQNLYLEGRRRIIEQERLASSRAPLCTTISLREPILENPMDYLKRCGAIASLASPALPSQSPSLSETPSSPPPPSPRERPSIIQDTPEYTYFPHKLNQ